MIKLGLVEGAREHLQLIIDLTAKQDTDLPIEDFVILSLYNSIINKIVDVKLLIDNNHYDSIEIIVRTIFEQYVYLKYILISDTKLKSEQFYYSYRIQSATKGKKIFTNFKNNKSLYGDLPKLDNQSAKQLGKQFVDEKDFDNQIQEYLIKFKDNIEYDPKKNKRYYENWYNIDNSVNNLKDLVSVKDMDIYESIYEILYAYGSMSVHGIDVPGNITPFEEGTILGKNINKSSNEVFVGVILLDLSRLVTKHYKLEKNSAVHSKLTKMKLSYKL